MDQALEHGSGLEAAEVRLQQHWSAVAEEPGGLLLPEGQVKGREEEGALGRGVARREQRDAGAEAVGRQVLEEGPRQLVQGGGSGPTVKETAELGRGDRSVEGGGEAVRVHEAQHAGAEGRGVDDERARVVADAGLQPRQVHA